MKVVVVLSAIALLTSPVTSQVPYTQSPVLDMSAIDAAVSEVVYQYGLMGLQDIPQPLLKAMVMEVLLRLPYAQQQQFQQQTSDDQTSDPAPGDPHTDTEATSSSDDTNAGSTSTSDNDNVNVAAMPDNSQPVPDLLRATSEAGDRANSQQDRDQICRLAPVTGFCRGYNPRFHFDPTSQQCRQFVYGGCGGNGNRFKSMEECMEFCKPQE